MPIYIGEFKLDLAGVHLSLIDNTLPSYLHFQYH